METKVLVTGGAGFLGSHLCDRLVERGQDVVCVDNFFTGSKRNVEHLLRNRRFELMRHDITFPLYVEVNRHLQPRVPGLARALPVRSRADDQDQRARRDQHARPRQAAEARASSRRPPPRCTATPRCTRRPEDYWGNVNPHRPAQLLRRGQALRRDAVLRLPPPARARHQGHPHLQHLRPAHAPERRPRRLELHRAGAAAARTSRSTATARRRASFCYVDDLIDGMHAA